MAEPNNNNNNNNGKNPVVRVAVNPYLSSSTLAGRKNGKDLKKKKLASSGRSASGASSSTSSSSTSSSFRKLPLASSRRSNSDQQQQTLSASSNKKKAGQPAAVSEVKKKALLATHAAASLSSNTTSSSNKSLKAKLKQDIEQLRRAQIQKRQAIEEERKKKREEKERRKQQKRIEIERKKIEAAAAEKLRQQQQQRHISSGNTIETTQAATGNSTAVVTAPSIVSNNSTGTGEAKSAVSDAAAAANSTAVTPTASAMKAMVVDQEHNQSALPLPSVAASVSAVKTATNTEAEPTAATASAGGATVRNPSQPAQQQQSQPQYYDHNSASTQHSRAGGTANNTMMVANPSSSDYYSYQQGYPYQYYNHHQQYPYSSLPYPAAPCWQQQQQQYYNSGGYASEQWMQQQQPPTAAAYHSSGAFDPAAQQQSWYPNSSYYHHQQHHLFPAHAPTSLPHKFNNPAPPQPRQRKATAKTKPSKIAEFVAPNPFCVTHTLSQTIVLIKPKDGSFGVTLRIENQSALVYPEWIQQQQEEKAKQKGTSTPAADVSSNDSIKAEITTAFDKGEEAAAAASAAPNTLIKGSKVEADTAQLGEGGPLKTMLPIEEPSTAVAAGVPLAKKQPRRRRYYFSAFVVQDATIQNSRHTTTASNTEDKNLLKQGDVVLQINGMSTAGLTFQDAITLIKNCNQPTADNDSDGMVRCTLLVARCKPIAPVFKPQTLTNTVSACQNMTGPLSDLEGEAYAKCLVNCSLDSKRMLGTINTAEENLVRMEPTLTNRSPLTIKFLWKQGCTEIESSARVRATENWRKEWEKESEDIQRSVDVPMTDAQRQYKRNAPRPAKGCRCGGNDHQYVNDPKCPLYSNLRALAPKAEIEAVDESTSSSSKISSKLGRDLKVVEKAFTERIVKMKEEQKAEENEAQFVRVMEATQLKVRNQAVFAPTSLSAMVLSTIMDLQESFKNEVGPDEEDAAPEEPQPVKMEVDSRSSNVEEDDSDDDDIPLAALGKRASAGGAKKMSPLKKPKRETLIRFKCLAVLMKAISEKWGHVFTEPSDTDYAWRWEVYHGQTGEESGWNWEANTKNPRAEGSLSLENIRFLIHSGVISRIENKSASPTDKSAALQALALVISPERSGVSDEILALIQTGVLRVNERGLLMITKNWWQNVDLLLLEDMRNQWGLKADPNNKCGMNEKLRATLAKKWRRGSYGWALAKDPRDIIYDLEDFDSWREMFEDKQQEQAHLEEGIGEFGL